MAVYDVTLNGALIVGLSQTWQIGPRGSTGVSGLGVPPPKTADVELLHGAGSYGSPDYPGVRPVTIPIVHRSSSPATAGAALTALRTTWAERAADVPLVLELPGMTVTVNGRPRGFSDDLTQIDRGVILVQLLFVALNPAIV